jgi:RimJ/RimL family protein N-acetyltransferase
MTTPQAWQGEGIREPLILVGRHVRLEPLAPSHAPDLYQAGHAADIWQYLATPRGPFASVSDAAQWVTSVLADYAAGVRLAFAVILVATGGAIGSTSYFFETRWANRTLEIGGTWLCPDYWRTAVNTECKYLLLRHAFETLGVDRIEFMTDARNLRSQRAIERLGAYKEGLLRAHMLCPDGHRRDSVFYSILDTEWPRVKTQLEAALAS